MKCQCKGKVVCPLTGLDLGKIAACKIVLTEKYLSPLADFALRVWMAKVFFNAGLTKLSNWESTLTLFEYEYAVPLLPTEVAAYVATAAELALPAMLVLGLGGRVAAVGLMAMVLVIELFVYPGTTEHYYWMLILAIIITRGPGKLSADHFIRKKVMAC